MVKEKEILALKDRSILSRPVFRCTAEGTLAGLGKRYSSVELQHKTLEWREA